MSLLTQASLGMSALLAERQQTTAASPAAFEWPGQDVRVARLMVRAAQAEQLATVQAARIRQLEAEIELLRGKTQPRVPAGQQGWVFSVPLGTAGQQLWCHVGEGRNHKDQPAVEAMWINGEWVSTEEFNGPLGFDVLDSEAARAEPRP